MTTNHKPRILLVNEASCLATGFSTIGMALMDRLFATGKYELFELANYLSPHDPRVNQYKWPVFCSMPRQDDIEYQNRFGSVQTAQFGSEVIESVSLIAQQDVTISITDPWMTQYLADTPYRKLSKFIYIPTIDGFPLRADWQDLFRDADMLLSYTKFGKDNLKKYFNLDVFDVLRPGVDHKVFYNQNRKSELREKFGINQDAHVLFTVMRNQRRKLFPNLFRDFAKYIRYCVDNNRIDLADKAILICQTSSPDVGFALDNLLIETGISHKVKFVSICDNCNFYKPVAWHGEVSPCPQCNRLSFHLPSPGGGLSREQLNELYQIADAYCAISISEGLGMGICEAKSCEIPAFAVDHSGMTEQVKDIEGCQLIKVDTLFDEPIHETQQRRALPDSDDFIGKIYKFFCQTNETRARWGKIAREDIVKNYTFDRAAKVMEAAIDTLVLPDHSETWRNPKPNYPPMDTNIPQGLTNGQFIDVCILKILNRPELIGTYARDSWCRMLNCGMSLGKGNRGEFNRNTVVQMFMDMAKKQMHFENLRLQTFGLVPSNKKIYEVI